MGNQLKKTVIIEAYRKFMNSYIAKKNVKITEKQI